MKSIEKEWNKRGEKEKIRNEQKKRLELNFFTNSLFSLICDEFVCSSV